MVEEWGRAQLAATGIRLRWRGWASDPYQFSFQEMWGSVFDQYFHYGTGAQSVGLQVHKLVLPAATGIDARAALSWPSPSISTSSVWPTRWLCRRKRAALDYLAQPFEALGGNFGRDEILGLARLPRYPGGEKK